MKHVSVKILPVLNGAVTQAAQRPRASRRTGGKLIMWKMRAWKASVGVGMGADEGCPPCAHRSRPDWERDQRRGPAFCLPANPLSTQRSHNSIIHPVFHYTGIKRMNGVLVNPCSQYTHTVVCLCSYKSTSHYAKPTQYTMTEWSALMLNPHTSANYSSSVFG